MKELLLAYYGDDFTGSTDVMEALTLGGVPTVLLLETPDAAFIQARFPHVRAVGIAGTSRSMTPAQMDAELVPKLTALKALNPPMVHYKICSTFDSSPTIGSIGHALEVGQAIFDAPAVPLVVGALSLKRYVVFGNLFAAVGGQTYRLDRHPTMSKHPVTPMDESDLRLHLGRQTTRTIGLIDLLQLNSTPDDLAAAYQALVAQGCQVVLFDTLDDTHLRAIGRLIWSQRRTHQPSFVVGSSGVEYALGMHWREIGLTQPAPAAAPTAAVDQLVVMSGSAAPTTMSQIQWALGQGYAGIRLNTVRLVDPTYADAEREHVTQQALAALSERKSVVMYSALGPDDAALAQTRAYFDSHQNQEEVSAALGKQQGAILRNILERTGLKRACVAGGDTSGQVAQQLGIFALEFVTSIAPGAPLCCASSHHAALNGLQIAFKGGQNGGEAYFGTIQSGAPSHAAK